MSLFITSLNSGSNGNCYYVGNDNEAVLIDAGISCREIEKRMLRLGLNLRKVKAVFVSHEHSDHIKGVCVLSKKYHLPVYITAATLKSGGIFPEENLIINFKADEPIQLGDLVITAFSKPHDACDPYSFIVSCNNIKVGVFTDIGAPCENLICHFQKCHAAFLEANYDEAMLENGNYPYHLKRRISGGKGHLSNKQALELFKAHKPPFMSHLFLSHLSKNNNNPERVQQLFDAQSENVKIIVASRDEETAVYEIGDTPHAISILKKRVVIQTELAFSFT
ncbi:MAG: MBL fold metallo-hydrolase [Ginsengibacter sp.]